MAVQTRDFLKARRDRALGSILGYAERELWTSLSQERQRAFRNVVIDALNGYHDSVLDLVKADGKDGNRDILDALKRIEDSLKS